MARIHSQSTAESSVAKENRLDGEDQVYLQMKSE